MSSFKKEATKGVVWSAIERFSVQGAQYVIGIILARLLMPSDYGLIAMLSIFMAIAQSFIDGGFGNALIQRQDRNQRDYSTVFYFNIAVAVVLYGALYACSPYIAQFFDKPQLDSVTKVVGLTLIINSLGIVQQTRMVIDLDFKRQAVAALVAVVISGFVGVMMAYNGFGVWALVWQALLNNTVRVIILWVFSRWMPSWAFSVDSFRQLFGFGSKLLLSSMLHTIFTNLYTVVIGKRFSAAELGFFNRSSTLAQFPSSNFTNVVTRVIYPLQCRIQDDDEQLRSMFKVYLRMACYAIFPVMVWLWAVSEPLIELMLTDKWLPAAPMMRILALAYMWDPVMKINHNMLNVKGRSDWFLQAEIIKKVVAVVILVISIPFGVEAMCWGLVLYSFADIAIIVRYSKRLTSVGLWQQVVLIAPIVVLCGAMAGVILLAMMPFEGSFVKLLMGSMAGAIFYLGASWLFKMREIRDILALVRR